MLVLHHTKEAQEEVGMGWWGKGGCLACSSLLQITGMCGDAGISHIRMQTAEGFGRHTDILVYTFLGQIWSSKAAQG